MAQCNPCGMASGGVHAPESSSIGISSKTTSMVTCPKLRLMVTMNKPIPDMVNTYKAVTTKNISRLPLVGKSKAVIKIPHRQITVFSKITKPIEITLGSRICKGVNGAPRVVLSCCVLFHVPQLLPVASSTA